MDPYEVMGIALVALCGLPALGLAVLRLTWLVGRVVTPWHQKIWD